MSNGILGASLLRGGVIPRFFRGARNPRFPRCSHTGSATFARDLRSIERVPGLQRWPAGESILRSRNEAPMKSLREQTFRQCKKLRLELLGLCTAVLIAASSLAQEARSPGWVVIPVAEYRTLHSQAYPAEAEPETSPVQATLTRIDYAVHISGDLAKGRVELTVDVLKSGWVSVPIPAGLMVRGARLDNKLVSLVPSSASKASAPLNAVLSHQGRSVLVLDIVLPVTSAAGTESITLPAANSGVTRASVDLPRQGVDVQVAGGLLSEKSEATANSRWVAYGQGNEPLTFTWRRKTEDHRTTQPLRSRGSLTELVSLGEDSTSIYAEVSVDIVQGVASDVRLQLPETVTVNQVLGAMVSDWQVLGGELVVTFLEPVQQSAKFVIYGETRLARDGQVSIPVLRLLKTERDTGGLAVEVLGAGEIKDLKTQGLEQADASDLSETVASRQSPSLAAFRFRSGEPSTVRALTVNVARYTQQAVLMANIEEARYQVLMSKEGKTLVQARYAVRNNQRNFVKITLPAGAVVWSAGLSGKPVRPGQWTDGSLLLPLEKARGGEEAPGFVVEVLYMIRGTAWEDKGKTRLALPALDLPVSRTGLLLYYPPLFRVSADPGPFRTEAYANPTSVAFNSPAPPPPTGGPVSLDLRNQKDDSTQALIDKFQTKSKAGRVTGILPIGVEFPAFGPSTYLVSELTSEGQFPAAELSYQRDKKAGAR